MQIGDYIYKNRKETSPQELALMARQLMEYVMELDRNVQGLTVEKAEFILTEETVGWKVELKEPKKRTQTLEDRDANIS